MTLTESLKAAIKSFPGPQSTLAALADVSPIQLSRFVSGERDILLRTADRIALALGMTVSRVTPPAAATS